MAVMRTLESAGIDGMRHVAGIVQPALTCAMTTSLNMQVNVCCNGAVLAGAAQAPV